MSECNLEAWTTVTMLSQNLYEVKFPNGELIPISPKNARDNRIYYKRRTTNNLWRTEPLYWLVLRIQTGAPLSVIRKSVWLLPIRNSHIFDHKYLFAPPILRPQYTPIAYPSQIGAQYNATLTIPPHRATFPAEVQTYQVNNHHWQYQRYWGCQSHHFQYIFPCGDFEVSLLNIRPPTYTQDFCQKLPDLENPYHSYTQAASLIQKRMAINHTWYSWPTLHANTTQPSISLQQSFGNYSMAELISDYQQLTPAVT